MKKPIYRLQYEPKISESYTEHGIEYGAKLNVADIEIPDAKKIYQIAKTRSEKNLQSWLFQHRNEFTSNTAILDITIHTSEQFDACMQRYSHPNVLYLTRPLHTVYHLDNLLNHANEILQDGGYLFCYSRTSILKKQLILKEYPFIINWIVYIAYFLWHRICPKLRFTEHLYYKITQGRNRTFHRVEVMGRLARAGFEVLEEEFRYGDYCVVARKVKPPICDDEPSCYPIIKLNRVGYHGKMIGVYKFRTMYSYSEYIQPYIYSHQHLAEGGKFADDYRINKIGRFLRDHYLDELPMIANMFKGDLKLVGVRPLSRQYFSLYTPEMQHLRVQTKPGLFPPFYAEKRRPQTIEEIQDSERRYIESYLKHPLRTDWVYFWKIIYHVLCPRCKYH